MRLNDKPSLGQLGETIAMAHLKRQGYRIHLRNWRYGRTGEIDIIAIPPVKESEEETVVFCEVKCRKHFDQGHPLEAITPRKQAQLLKLTEAFLMNHPEFTMHQVRFDVIAISFPGPGRPAEIQHLENVMAATN